MEEAKRYKERLQAIAGRQKLLADIQKLKQELDEERVSLQQLKRKSLRDRWLMEGTSPPTEEDILSSPIGKAQTRVQQLEENIARLQAVMNNFEGQEEGVQDLDPKSQSKETPIKAEFSTHNINLKAFDEKLNEGQSEEHGGDLKMTEVCTTNVQLDGYMTAGGIQENGEIPRRVLHTMEISVEKDMKTGAAQVLSANPLTAAEFEGKDMSEVYRDGTNAIYAVASQVMEQEIQLSPEVAEIILDQVKQLESEPELLNKANKQMTEIVNGLPVEEPFVDKEGKQSRERQEEDTQEEFSERNHLEKREEKLLLSRGPPSPNSHLENIQVQSVRSEEEKNLPVGSLQKYRSGVEVQKNSNVAVLQTDMNLNEMVPSLVPVGDASSMDTVTLNCTELSDTNTPEAEDMFGRVLRAERVIITEDGEELSMDFDSDARISPIMLGLESHVEKEKLEVSSSDPTRPTEVDLKKLPTTHDVLTVKEQIHVQQMEGAAMETHEEVGTTLQNLSVQEGKPVPEKDTLQDKDQNSSVSKQNPSLQVDEMLSEEPELLTVEKEQVPIQLNPFLQDQHLPLQDQNSTTMEEKPLLEEHKILLQEQEIIMQKEEPRKSADLQGEKAELLQETVSLEKHTIQEQENTTEEQNIPLQGDKLFPERHKQVVHGQEQIIHEQKPPLQLETLTQEENKSAVQEEQVLQANASTLQGANLLPEEHKQVVYGHEQKVEEQKLPQQLETLAHDENEPAMQEEEQILPAHVSLLQGEKLLPEEHIPVVSEKVMDDQQEKPSLRDTPSFHDQNLLFQKNNLSGDEKNSISQEEDIVAQEQLPLLQVRPEPTTAVLSADGAVGDIKPETQPLLGEIKPAELHSFQATEPPLHEIHLEPTTTSNAPASSTAPSSKANAPLSTVQAATEPGQSTELEAQMDGKQLAQPKQKTCQCCSVM